MRRVLGVVCPENWTLCGHNGSPHGSVMSCQSLATRAFIETDKDGLAHCTRYQSRTVRFTSESNGTSRIGNGSESKKESSGSISLTALSVTPVTSHTSTMSQSVPSASSAFDVDDDAPPPVPSCRFPKLEECAHFHYERVSLGGVSVETVPCVEEKCGDPSEGWICLKVRSHVSSSCDDTVDSIRTLTSSWREASDDKEWTLTRNKDNLLHFDDMLHRCIYDRKVSGLPNLKEKITAALLRDESEYTCLISDYVHHFSIIADDTINCGPILNWLQMDNKGHKLLVANEDSSSINTPAVAAAYSVRKYVSQARDEISFDVGDMISVIDMPGPNESIWWRGKRGFRVGFFPHHCVAVIGDKVPRNMTQPPPIVGSVAVQQIKPVLRKHGKLISLFRSFILSRPSRRSLKQQGILKERVFGCDLGEHLLNCGEEVPVVLVECAKAIEARGAVDGIYRLSGGAATTQRLRAALDAGQRPQLGPPNDPHAVASLLKMYFRELPNPLCTYQLYEGFVQAVQGPDEAAKLRAVRDTVVKLPPPHYRTLAYLMRHLRRVSLLGDVTGMTARNMAIVWAPNLLRSPRPQHALQGVAVQAVVTEFLICYAEELFAEEQDVDSGPNSLEQDREDSYVELRGHESGRRPKSLPLHPPTKLLSLEEARRRGQSTVPTVQSPRLPPPSGAIAAAANTQLRPSGHLKPKYIEVGPGPNNLPQYHTVLDLPAPGAKRGLKRSPSGWRGLFSRSKQQRQRALPVVQTVAPPPVESSPMSQSGIRPVKSYESLTDTDTLAPLSTAPRQLIKQHTRSSSCDSYFEPWQAELVGMRLRLSPQERDRHIFSEEEPDQENTVQDGSFCSTPLQSEVCSVEPSPRRNLLLDIHVARELAERKQRNTIEEQLSQIGYIDGDSPRGKMAAEKRPPRPDTPPRSDVAKRVCKDRESPSTPQNDFLTSLANVKLRERNSPRKTKNTSRYSGMHHPVNLVDDEKPVAVNTRLTWHGKDGHSTLIKIDWPLENSSVSNRTTSTLNSSPLTPITPLYDPLESDSEISEANKHTITIKGKECDNCDEEKCLKCELKAADSENIREVSTEQDRSDYHDSLEPSPIHSTDISYQNLNRLSAVSNSSNSENHSGKKQDNSYENLDTMKVMTSSHESSSSYSNVSMKHDELFECYKYSRPNYINLQSSSTSKSSTSSPLKSPLKSTISITFRSPTKTTTPDYEPIDIIDTPKNERDSVYEDIDLEKNLTIMEEATVPLADASLPTQEACQPETFNDDLIILETPTEQTDLGEVDIYSQVKFFKKSIEEVNAMILETPEKDNVEIHYENVAFDETTQNDYENVTLETIKNCDTNLVLCKNGIDNQEPDEENVQKISIDNGNTIDTHIVTKNLNVRELANRFESPTEQKTQFCFEKFKPEIKFVTLDYKESRKSMEHKRKEVQTKNSQAQLPVSYKLTRNSSTARSLDESAFVKEFGHEKKTIDRRKSLEVRDATKHTKFVPDLNLNVEENESKGSITPTTENKISIIQRFEAKMPSELKSLVSDTSKLSRERIEKYKEERRNFLREKYSSQSFRSSPEQLTRIKLKRDIEDKEHRMKENMPKFERRNTVDLGQRMRFSLARSSNNLEIIQSPLSPDKNSDISSGGTEFTSNDKIENVGHSKDFERKEKVSPSYNIRDMAALFEQKSQSSNTG